jgi:hypothetical protein
MNPMGREADDETDIDEEPLADSAEEIAAATGEDEPEAQGGAAPPSPPLPTRPLPRRVPSQNPNRTAPAVSPPTDHTVRHLLDILKRLP